MRTAHLFLDLGTGWENVTNHTRPHAALSELSIEWGTDKATEQPDVNVLSFRVLDRNGSLAGRTSSLAGCRVMVQLTAEPQWSQTSTSTLTWRETQGQWKNLHDNIDPDSSAPPSDRNLTLFTGRVTTGGTIEKDGESWILQLTAASDMILAKRDQKQGPVSGDFHWTGTTRDRVTEIARRLVSDGAPILSDDAKTLLSQAPPVAWYDLDTYPSLLGLLSKLAGSLETMPLLMENPNAAEMRALPTNIQAAITIHSDATMTASAGSIANQVIQGAEIIVNSESLELPDPVSQILLKGKKAEWNDDKLSFDDVEQAFNSQGLLPQNLTDSQSSISIETDAVLSNDAGSHFPGGAWEPQDKSSRAQWLQTNTLRLRPAEFTLTSRKTNITDHEECFTPSGFLLGFVHNTFTSLLSDDGKPATSGVWLAIGGTLSFTSRPRPEFRNELILQPLPMRDTSLATWGALTPITLPYSRLSFTWAELGTITEFAE